MPLDPAQFAKCAPSIGTNIKQCGSVTVCSAKPVTADEFASIYQKSGDYRVMGALFKHDFEIRACEAVQNGMYDFLMSVKVNMQKKIESRRRNGRTDIMPFVMARQYSPINDNFWTFTGGQASGQNWSGVVATAGNVPFDVRSFPVGMIVWILGRTAGGSASKTAWEVTAIADNGNDTGTVTMSSLNAGSFLPAAKLASPVSGVLMQGVPNKSDFEKWCAELTAYLNWKDVPFFYGTYRTSRCRSSQYDLWRSYLIEDNPLYREYGDLTEIEKNKQLQAKWQRQIADLFFWSTPRQYQNANQYDQLAEIDAFDPSTVGLTALGVDGGTCVGRRADPAGVYEQMAECQRIVDLQGAALNLPALFNQLYHMGRVKEGANNKNAWTFDLFTDSVTAQKFQIAWVNYMNALTGNAFRITQPLETKKTAQWGFQYNSYTLDFPQGATLNVIWHRYFDDAMAAAKLIGDDHEATMRRCWILDFSGIYPGIIATNSRDFKVGRLEDLAKISPDYACVLETNTLEQWLMSMTMTVVVECTHANLILENISSAVPDHVVDNNIAYPGATTTTTSTTPAPWEG